MNTTPKKYRKKPVVVEAVQFVSDGYMTMFEIATWCGGRLSEDAVDNPIIVVHALGGDVIAEEGDWIVRGVEGEFYPCKDSIFRATYEEGEA